MATHRKQQTSHGSNARKTPAGFNTTAYRIFRMLTWLMETPLSVDEMNRRFASDPLIAKRVSSDSVWLYINTLKALGCEIDRPMPSNGYCYRMIRHPFGLRIDDDRLDMLFRVKAVAADVLPEPEMLAVNRLFKTLLSQATLPENAESPEAVLESRRYIDYADHTEAIDRLRRAAAEETLLSIVYQSPVKGRETLVVLPEEMYFLNGALYVSGTAAHRDEAVHLRVDRMRSWEAVDDAERREQLIALRERQIKTVVLNVFVDHPEEFEPLGMGERTQWVGSAGLFRPEAGQNGAASSPARPYLSVTVKTRDWFTLKQKLLAGGALFTVVQPAAFRQEVASTLEALGRMYDEDVREEGTADGG